MARFKVELSQAVQSTHDSASQKIPSNRHDQAIEPSGDISNETVISDYEGMESSNIITGSCPDMCPGISLNISLFNDLKVKQLQRHIAEVLNS